MTNMENLSPLKLNSIYVRDIKRLSRGCEILLVQNNNGKVTISSVDDYSYFDDYLVLSIDCIDYKLLVLEV